LNETYAANYAAFIAPLQASASFVDNATKTVGSEVNGMAYKSYRKSAATATASITSKDPPTTGGVYATRFDLSVTYPCPEPFCDASSSPSTRPLPLVGSSAKITLPPHITLVNGQQSVVPINVFMAGTTINISWNVLVNDTVSKSASQEGANGGARVSFDIYGIVSNTMPATLKSPTETYPQYSYSDRIGVVIDIRAP
jgi:hypothetical protein